ncbi:MAG: MFS transporter [Gaiellaceae bacterium]
MSRARDLRTRLRAPKWRSLVGATLAQVGLSFLEQGVPSLVPFLKRDLGLSSAVAGLFGTGINLGRSIAGPFSAGSVERLGERRAILLGCWSAGLLAIAAGLTKPAPLVLFLLVLSGTAQTVAVLAGINAVAIWFTTGARGIAMGVRQTAVPLGGVFAAAALPFLALSLGWRPALMIAGGMSLVTALVGVAIYRDHPSAERPERQELRTAIPAILRDRWLRRAIAIGVVLAGGQYAVVAYVQLYVVEDLARSASYAAAVLVVTQAAGICGRMLWGFVSDIAFGGSRREVLAAILGLGSAAALGMALMPRDQAWVAFPLAAVLGLSALSAPGMFLVQISDLSSRTLRVTTLGVAIGFIQAATFVVPPLFGLLDDLSGSFRASWFALAALFALALPVTLSIRTGPQARGPGGGYV